MHVELGLNQHALRRWHVELARRLGQAPDMTVGIRWTAPKGEPLPACVSALLRLERSLHASSSGWADAALPTDLSPWVGAGGAEPDLVIDLAGGDPAAGRRRWSLKADGRPGEAPIFAALLEGRAPVITIADVAGNAPIASARPAIGATEVLTDGYNRVVARIISLLVAAARGRTSGARMRPTPSRIRCGKAASVGARTVARAARERLVPRNGPTQPHTRVGWRFVTGPDVVDLGGHPATGWQVLPDDGRRAYGQPFPLVVRGEPWLFLTELDFSTRHRSISALRFAEAGPAGRPVPVLDFDGDVSFPHVFEADGTVWMIPQRAGQTGIDLFRASRFPGGWRHEARLVDGLEAQDASPFRHGGRWWMIATVKDGGSSSDMLHLWSAAELHGPWKAHPRNPVLIDAATARSAGRIVKRNGRLIRPVQDRRDERKRVLALAEILRLDEEGFEQRVLTEIAAGSVWPGRGISTLNRAGALECIDGADFPVFVERAPRPARVGGGRDRRVAEAALPVGG